MSDEIEVVVAPEKEFEVDIMTQCDHCLRAVDPNDSMQCRTTVGPVTRCFSCGSGLSLEEFRRRKAEGLPIPQYGEEAEAS